MKRRGERVRDMTKRRGEEMISKGEERESVRDMTKSRGEDMI